MMQLCNGGRGRLAHDEICYEGIDCPLCDVRNELLEQINELKKEIENFQEEE